MRNLTLIVVALLTLFTSCKHKEDIVVAELTEQEKADLIYLREEEKLARDVYLYAYDKYAEDIFVNISKSEQKHMDKVLDLLNTYSLPDPASADRGVFTNTMLQQLYNDLTAEVDKSLIDALKVGATIEDLDIYDIEKNEGRTSISDLENLYEKLKCGSKNHIQSFNTQIVANSATYIPQYITQEYLNSILAGGSQKCGK